FVFKGHSEKQSIRNAEFSSDGDRIVSASSDQTLRIWDAMTNVKPLVVKAHNKSAVRQIEVSGDGKHFATVAKDGTAKLWDAGPANEIRPAKFNLSDGGIVTGAAFGPLTGQVTILLRNGFALIKDTTTNSVLWTNSSGSTHDTGQGIGTRLMSA